MKFLHTSDLHIGIKLSGYSLDDDIRHVLRGIVECAKREGCTAVVLAGDIYDRSNPTPSANVIFDEFVTSCAEAGIAVIAVSGNHDSPERVAYMSSLLLKNGVHFSPVFDGEVRFVDLSDEYGVVRFYMLPFIRPVNVREMCADFNGKTYSEAISHVTEKLHKDENAPSRRVMVTHQFVTSGASADDGESDAEVGGIGNVSSSVFDGFSYTALGHIHKAYNVGRGNVRYCGSPLKLSFSEVEDEKSVTVVEIDADGGVNTKTVAIPPLRDMREIRGSYEYVTSREARESGAIDDYLRIVLTDDEMIEDVSAKLRCIYPNLMRIAYDNVRTREIRDVTEAAEREIDAISPIEVFAELFELQNNAAPNRGVLEIAESLFAECTEDFMGGERV